MISNQNSLSINGGFFISNEIAKSFLFREKKNIISL